jgi:lysophospholipase L1-like esterase
MLLASVAFVVSPVYAAPGTVGVPRTDANSGTAHEQLLRKARQGRIDVYFEGDSITRRWGCSDPQYAHLLANWTTNFLGWNAANFGWGGDRVENILWRLENGELDGVNPKVIVLLAGTNNLRDSGSDAIDEPTVEQVLKGIRSIIAVTQSKAPKATLVLMGITARKDHAGGAGLMPTLREINRRLSAVADGRRIRFIDLNPRLTDSRGRVLDGVTVDGLHLSVKGYQLWADALKPMFLELLGPPARVDLAPPPTGDPSAKHAP